MDVQPQSPQPLSGSSALTINPHEREQQKKRFIDQHGWGKATYSFLAADASFRSYYRLTQNNSSCILMDAPPPYENTLAFAQIAECLLVCGLSAPRIYTADHEHGFLLIEDFGDYSYNKALSQGENEVLLYRLTLEALRKLHQCDTLTLSLPHLPSYSEEKFLKEVLLFFEWYLPSNNIQLDDDAKTEFEQAWQHAYKSLPPLPQSLILRDVLVDNLMYLPDRPGIKACGFLDFQDALVGPICYDIVSLLEDARRDIDPDFAMERIKEYINSSPNLCLESFLHAYRVWGAQRSTRILGVFSRLAYRDGKTRYLSHIPRIWKIVERNLQYPGLEQVKSWFANYIPPYHIP